MDKYKLKKVGIAGIIISVCLAGCSKDVDCNINGEHVHIYVNNSNGLTRLIEGEKETKCSSKRTDDYVIKNNETDIICDNKLCKVKDNISYLYDLSLSCQSKKQEYSLESVYEYYYGYGGKLAFTADGCKYECTYSYGLGYHDKYIWKDLEENTTTENEVRDVTYQFKLYKLEENGTLTSKYFDCLEEIESGYEYFLEDDLIKENYSEAYYLKSKEKKLETK